MDTSSCRHRSLRTAALLVLSTALHPSARAQEPPFRAGVELLEITVSAIDRDGRPIADLTADDFVVRIDGRARKVQTLARWSAAADRLPVGECRLDPAADATSYDRQWPIASNLAGDGHRLVAVVLDDILTSPRRTMPVRRAAREFVEGRLADGDAIAVITTSGQANVDGSFTTTRDAALARIDRFFGQAHGSLVRGAEAALAARRMMEVIGSLGRLSQDLGGPPLTVVLFSEGVEFDIYDSRALDANDVLQAIRATVESLRTGNLVLYAIDPRGLVTPEDGLVERNTYREDSVVGSIASATRMAALRRSLQSLRQMAEETGGFAAVDRNDFDGAFDRIVAESGSLYVLGVEAVEARRGGSRIDVSVRRPGARVSARRRYVRSETSQPQTPSESRQHTVRALLSSPTSAGALPISAQVVPLDEGGEGARTAILLVEVDPAAFRDTVGDDGTLAVELAVIGIDDGGEVVGATIGATATIRLTDDIKSRLDEYGFRWLHEFELATSARDVRIALDVADGSSGIVVAPVVAPGDGGRGPSIGAVLVASAHGASAVTAGSAPSLRFVRAAPTTRRTFADDDLVEFGVRVLPENADVPEDGVMARLISETGRVRQITLEPRVTETARPLHAGPMPLAGFPAGDHHVEIQMHAPAGSDRARLPLCVHRAD
jgi:VWFA-related protein